MDNKWLIKMMGFVFVLFLSVGGLHSLLHAQDRASTWVPTPIQKVWALAKGPNPRHARVKDGQSFFKGATYVGSEKCADCHTDRHAEWLGTKHSTMKLPALDHLMPALFNGEIQTFTDVASTTPDGSKALATFSVRPFKQGEDFFFEVIHPTDPTKSQTFKIALRTGGKWDQAYEAELDDNHTMPAPLRYSVADELWLSKGQSPGDWVVVENGAARPRTKAELSPAKFAQGQCWTCHTTGPAVIQNEKKVWDAKGRERGIACESCHGPGSRHVAEVEVAQVKRAKLVSGMLSIVHPVKDLNAKQQDALCNSCHTRYVSNEKGGVPGPRGFLPGDLILSNSARPMSYLSADLTEQAYFWKNGWSKRGNQQGQVVHTKHADAGVTCVACHVFHGNHAKGQIRGKVADSVCATCHGPKSPIDTFAFYKGSPMEKAGVTCVDCHMSALGFRTAETSIGKQRWTVASHEFRTSTPMMERDGESRSSCTACHIEPPTDVSPHGHLNVKPKLHTLTSLSALYEKRQADIARRIATLKTDLAAVDTTVLAAKKEYDAAMALLRMIEKASGNGVHNFARTNSLLLQAQKLADLANSLDAPGSAAAAVPKASPTIRSQPNVAANPPVKRAPAQKLAP